MIKLENNPLKIENWSGEFYFTLDKEIINCFIQTTEEE